MSDTTTHRPKVLRFFRDKKGEYRWHVRAGNGRVIADGAEGYRRLTATERGALSVMGGTGLSRVGDGRHGYLDGRPDVRVEWDT